MSKPKIMTDLAQVKAKEEELRQGIEDRGYLSSFISGADLNTFTQNGIYAYSRVSANRPSETYGYLFVSDWGEGFCRQIAQDNDNHCYVRVMGDNVWGDWQQLATTEQIEVLSNDRGYLTSKVIYNMDDLKFNGKFIFSGEIEGITASWHVDVTSGINTHLQIATTTWDNTDNTRGITFTRIFCDGKWNGWQQLATTEQIEVLSNDRGYLTSKVIYNMDDLKFNGKFIFSGEIEGITASWHVDVTSGINTHLQIATTTWDNTGNTRGITFTRIFCDGKWNGWRQIATTTKTDILVEPKLGYKITENKSYQINNIVYIRVKFMKEDETPFPSTSYFSPFRLPSGLLPSAVSLSYCGLDVGWIPNGYGSAMSEGSGTVFIINRQSTSTTRGYVDGVIVL